MCFFRLPLSLNDFPHWSHLNGFTFWQKNERLEFLNGSLHQIYGWEFTTILPSDIEDVVEEKILFQNPCHSDRIWTSSPRDWREISRWLIGFTQINWWANVWNVYKCIKTNTNRVMVEMVNIETFEAEKSIWAKSATNWLLLRGEIFSVGMVLVKWIKLQNEHFRL